MNTATTNKLHNLTARRKLKPRAKPYWVSVEPKLTLGYLSRPGQAVGTWIARRETGRRETKPGTKRYAYPAYAQWGLGTADDLVPADGVTILSFSQAMTKAAGTNQDRRTGRTSTIVTVKNAIDAYLTYLEQRKGERARRDADGKLKTHVCGHRIADLAINDLTSDDLEAWQAGLVKTDKGPEIKRRSQDSANRILATLKAVLNRAWQDKHNGITSDQSWRRIQRFKKVAKPRVHHFSIEEVRHLIACATPLAFQQLLEAAYCTGCRYGELMAVNVGHLDVKRSHLLVPSGKTGSRTVTLAPEGVDFFARLARNRSVESPLLLAPDGARWRDCAQRWPFTRTLKQAGLYRLDTLGRPPSFYALRHTYISRLRQQGAADWLVAQNAGTSPAMIERTYGKVTDEERREMIAKFTPSLREAPHAVA